MICTSKGFFSKVDLVKEINKFKEEGQQQHIDYINHQSEISAAAHVEDKMPISKPGTLSSHTPSTGINLKVENGLSSAKINGKEFDNQVQISNDEYER